MIHTTQSNVGITIEILFKQIPSLFSILQLQSTQDKAYVLKKKL